MKIRIVKNSKISSLNESILQEQFLPFIALANYMGWQDAEDIQRDLKPLTDSLRKTAKNDPLLILQTILEFAGVIPAVGLVGDALAMIIAFIRRKPIEAAINFIAMAPALGLGAVAMRAAYKTGGKAAMREALDLACRRAFGANWITSAQKASKEAIEDAYIHMDALLKAAGVSNPVILKIQTHFQKFQAAWMATLIVAHFTMLGREDELDMDVKELSLF